MQVYFPKEVTVLSVKFKVKKDPSHNGGSFSLAEEEIVIGTECLDRDPMYTFMIICHEVSEIVHECIGTRYRDSSVEGNWKFFWITKSLKHTTGYSLK